MGKASKDRRDIFYRMAKEQGWRARSAFKLLQADETFNLLEGVTRAVDLCAAPGGWSQVLSKKLYEPKSEEERKKVKIIAVDMQGMAPIDGVTELRADITKESTSQAIIEFFEGKKAQLVVSDGAPDITGVHDWDAYMQAQLLLTALSISTFILEEGGSFMGKVYRAANTSDVYRQIKRFFKEACVFKPSASRNSSIEAFVVCRQFCTPVNHVPRNLITEWLYIPGAALVDVTNKKPEKVEHLPFVAHECEFDADLSYELNEDYVYHEAVQKPLTAAYQEAVDRTSTMCNRYQGYKISHIGEPQPPQETEVEYGPEDKEDYDDSWPKETKEEKTVNTEELEAKTRNMTFENQGKKPQKTEDGNVASGSQGTKKDKDENKQEPPQDTESEYETDTDVEDDDTPSGSQKTKEKMMRKKRKYWSKDIVFPPLPQGDEEVELC